MMKRIRPKEIIQQRNRRLKLVTLSLLLIGLGYFIYWWHTNYGWVSTDDAFVTGHLIILKAQTDGTVVEIRAENTQFVERGDILVRLDGTRAEIALQQTEAELGEAVRHIVNLTAKIDMLNQRIAVKKAALIQVRHDLQRFVMAARDGAVSEQQVQNAQDKARELEAAIGETRAELVGVKAEVLGTPIPNHPVVEKAKSQVRQAYLNFYRRNIVAPVSGYIAKRQVQIGDNVKAGTPLLAIIPLDDLWIEANFLETKIRKIRPGQSVEIKADVYENEVIYHGKVEGLSPGTGSIFALLPPENATGNFIRIAERIPVRIALDPKELKENPLQPGLSTVTRINITEPGQPLLTSFTTVKGSAYRTTVYDHELDGAELRIQQIINSNMP